MMVLGLTGYTEVDGSPAGTYRVRNDVTLGWEIHGMDGGIAYFGR